MPKHFISLSDSQPSWKLSNLVYRDEIKREFHNIISTASIVMYFTCTSNIFITHQFYIITSLFCGWVFLLLLYCTCPVPHMMNSFFPLNIILSNPLKHFTWPLTLLDAVLLFEITTFVISFYLLVYGFALIF